MAEEETVVESFNWGGALGVGDVAELREVLIAQLESGERLAVDLSEIESLDAAVVQLLCAAHRHLVSRGERLRLTGELPAPVASILRLLGVVGPDQDGCGGCAACFAVES